MRDQQNTEIGRREFLRTGLTAAIGAATLGPVVAGAALPRDKKIALAGEIPTRKFGKTGHILPVLGHGGSAMSNQFMRAYGVELEGEDARVAMVRHGYDKGIRYFDTARVYGESERIVGKALKDVRDNVFIATKVAVADPAKVRESVETSLKELDTNYIDLMQIHSPAIERVGADGGMKIHAELLKLRDEGMIRFIGLTTHIAFEDVHKMIDTGGFDSTLLAYGYFRRGMLTLLSSKKVEWRERCLARAHELGMAIVAMKVVGADIYSHNAKNVVPDYDPSAFKKLPAAAIRYVLADPRVSMLNIGVSFAGDIDENVATVCGDPTFTNADRELLADFTIKAYDSDHVKKMAVT